MRISFEGLDGTGKTTQIKLLEKKYKTFKSPNYNSPLGKLIKDILYSDNIDHNYISLLFLADLLETDKIITEKYKNEIVILDRSFLSTLAYQDIDYNIPKKLNFSIPDKVFYFECKNKKFNRKKDTLEKDNYFQKIVEENYKKVFNFFNIKPIIINTDTSIEKINKEITKNL